MNKLKILRNIFRVCIAARKSFGKKLYKSDYVITQLIKRECCEKRALEIKQKPIILRINHLIMQLIQYIWTYTTVQYCFIYLGCGLIQ